MSTYTDMAPQQLKPIHHQMILLLEALGHMPKEIAEITRYTVDGVYITRQSHAYQEQLANLREKIQNECIANVIEKVNHLALKSIEVYEQILHDPQASPREKHAAAREVLKFAIEINTTSRPTTTPKELESLIVSLERALDKLSLEQENAS